MYWVPSHLYSNLQSGFLVERLNQVLLPEHETAAIITFFLMLELNVLRELFWLFGFYWSVQFEFLFIYTFVNLARLLRGGGGGGKAVSPLYNLCAVPKDVVFEPFWSENGYRFWS